MYRIEIKHAKKNCGPRWFYLQGYTGMQGQQNIKKASSVSRIHDHTQTHHPSGGVISPTQRQHSQLREIHEHDEVRKRNPSQTHYLDFTATAIGLRFYGIWRKCLVILQEMARQAILYCSSELNGLSARQKLY
jgi:hypothetical protein